MKRLKRIFCVLFMFALLSMSEKMAMASISIDVGSGANEDLYAIEGQYVPELVEMEQETLDRMSIEEASRLFEKAFHVDSAGFSEKEIRMGVNGLSFALRFQGFIETFDNSIQLDSLPARNRAKAVPAEDGCRYSGSKGVAWVRKTSTGYSPLTLGEILSGVYTLEVDYLTWDTVAAMLAASADYNAFKDLAELVAVGAGGAALAKAICTLLGITAGAIPTITSVAVGAVVGLGWNWLKSIDRSNMYKAFKKMSNAKTQYMKIQFLWASDMVNKCYSIVPKTEVIPNPFPGICGEWFTNRYGYMYGY